MVPSATRVRRALVAFAACFLLVRIAAAEPARLALVDADAELERAVRVALSAWKTTVLPIRIEGPGSTMPGSAERARHLASQYRALAVVWISKSADGYALWMYDARDDRVVARRLTSPPPFDDATAAAVALAVKTMLRQSDVPPPDERVAEPVQDPLFSVALVGGIRPQPTSEEEADVRLGLGAIVWPRLGLNRLALGAGLEVASGPGVSVEETAFTGRWTETTVLALAVGRWTFARAFDFSLEPGVGVGVSVVSGGLADPRDAVRFTRMNALGSLQLGAGYRPSRALRVGLTAGLMRLWRTQTYLVEGDPVLEVNSLRFEAGLSIEAGLF